MSASLMVPLLDQKGLLKQICSSVKHLLQQPTDLYSASSSETLERLNSLCREVITVAKTGLAPDLGPKLFALYQELDSSVDCSAFLEEWKSIEDDEPTREYLIAMTYLKLSALCTFDEARYVWASLAKEDKCGGPHPYEALEDLDLIKLHFAGDDDQFTYCHEFLAQGMSLICEAYYEQSPKYKLYMALKEADVPSGYYYPRGYGDNVNTEEMVRFLISQLEGNLY